MSVQSYCEAVRSAQKVNLIISQHYICGYSSQRPGEVTTRDLIDDFITDNFRLISVPNKIPDLPNEKDFPNGTCSVNVRKMNNIKQVMKYTDHDQQHVYTFILVW
jgi:hypothetical protein